MGRNMSSVSSHDVELAPTIALTQMSSSPKDNTIVNHLEPSTTSRSRADYTFPEGGTEAWLVVFGSFCVIAATYGLMSSVGLFQAYCKSDILGIKLFYST